MPTPMRVTRDASASFNALVYLARRFVKNCESNDCSRNGEFVVPSIMVLVLGDDVSLSSVADAVVAGAKRVRFTEVTTRATKADVFRHRTLEADASLASFD